MANRHVFHGTGVSAGIACGPAVLVAPAAGVDPHEPPCTDPEADGQRVRAAFDDVAASLLARAANAPEASPILEATATLAKDRALAKAVDKELASGTGVTAAVHAAVEVYAQKLRDLGGYMAQRVTDLYDVRDRTIARLRDVPEPGVPPLRRPSVLVAHDLAPAEAALLDPVMVLGLVTEVGGATSHTAILAAQLGIPMIVQVAGITELLIDATPITLDPTTGTVILSPTSDDIAELRDRLEVPAPREDIPLRSQNEDGRPGAEPVSDRDVGAGIDIDANGDERRCEQLGNLRVGEDASLEIGARGR